MQIHRRVFVAGFGNLLRGDDGFGVIVARRLLAGSVPHGVTVLDVGIGGIHLVQELLEGADGLVVVDAVAVDRPPGTVIVMHPDVMDVDELPARERRDALADMHYATPERALMLARAMGVLPEEVFLVGCQPADAETLGDTLSSVVRSAVDTAAAEVRRVVSSLGIPWA